MTDQDIISYYKDKVVHSWKTILQEHKDYLDTRYTDSKSYKESVWRILYNIEERPVCQVCGKEVDFVGRKHNIFAKTCSKKCNKKIHIVEHNYTQEELFYQSLSQTEKTKYTCLKKYGVEHVSQLSTNIFKLDNPQKKQKVKDKTKKTRIKKYGQYMSPNNAKALLTNESKQKRVESFNNTMIEKYGDVNYRNWNKHKQTCIEKYGVDSWSKTNEFKQMMTNNHNEIQTKRYKTFKLNKSFNTSKPEQESYKLLKEKFPDTIYQYKDKERYPFVCDFYIPSLDLFIECNYHWTHGGKLFEGTKEDLEVLDNWKSSKSKYYKIAIVVWTKRDIEKYQCAIKNDLNYLLFYNIDELKNWLTKNN